MSLAPVRYLIELGPPFRAEAHYLHAFEVDGEAGADAGHEWSPDRTRALRFASRAEAEGYAFAHVDETWLVVGHPASELVGCEHRDPEDEADLVA